MRDIIFYDFDFNRLGDFAKTISINIEKKYCGYGSAELHYGICEQELIHLLEDNEEVFFIIDGIAAIVTGWQAGTDITVYARTPEWLLTRRGVEPMSFSDTNAEVIARAFVEAVSDFVVLGEMANVGTVMNYSTEKVRVLYDVIYEVLNSKGLGFKVIPDTADKRFVFEVYEGAKKDCIISPSSRTAYDMKYTVEKQDMVTRSGWYQRRYMDKGLWDAMVNSPGLSNNNPTNAYTFYKITSEDYNSSGDRVKCFGLWCRKGTYLYCDNQQGIWKISDTKPDTIWVYIDNKLKSGLRKWDAVIDGIKTEEEANAEILQMTAAFGTDCQVYRLEYDKDYSLGDIVRVQLELGSFKKTEKKRVDSVNIYYDIDGSGVTPILNSLEE